MAASTARGGCRARSLTAHPQIHELRVKAEVCDLVGCQRKIGAKVCLNNDILKLLAIAENDRAESRRIASQAEISHVAHAGDVHKVADDLGGEYSIAETETGDAILENMLK